MTDHPITPPPELVQQWFDIWQASDDDDVEFADYVATRAAQYGADQELEACCADLRTIYGIQMSKWLRSMRRPKPPSLKAQALKALGDAVVRGDNFAVSSAIPAIRRALEALPE
jgi:hypothetical protein